MAEAVDHLRERAGRQIIDNLRWLADVAGSVAGARQIYREELARSKAEARAAGLSTAGDNRFDALRHARASKRISEASGPLFAQAAGAAHEGQNVIEDLIPAFVSHNVVGPYGTAKGPRPGQVLDEIRMDLHNNAEGRRAAMARRPIDEARLAMSPTASAMTALYRTPPETRTGTPPR